MRTEPPVSEPMPAAARPRATEVAAPQDEPPGARGVSSITALAGVPVAGLVPMPPSANCTVLVLPRQTRPARVARASTVASRVGTRPASRGVPPSVAVSAVS